MRVPERGVGATPWEAHGDDARRYVGQVKVETMPRVSMSLAGAVPPQRRKEATPQNACPWPRRLLRRRAAPRLQQALAAEQLGGGEVHLLGLYEFVHDARVFLGRPKHPPLARPCAQGLRALTFGMISGLGLRNGELAGEAVPNLLSEESGVGGTSARSFNTWQICRTGVGKLDAGENGQMRVPASVSSHKSSPLLSPVSSHKSSPLLSPVSSHKPSPLLSPPQAVSICGGALLEVAKVTRAPAASMAISAR
eukprot:CAMPEP_0117540270 /NCGR_PEP_ID=MMETSP0784-20121206/43413_1 /TAXON_ID=39447 /ORGANISM="" /LENGTH=251 /DNA_ID=CAMNT_0005336921 /DNA_START=1246 /DNA_END=1998 /DNA_ORIENTATION=-